VDDYIPVDKFSGEPAFSKTLDNTYWLCILEKAWAKIHGTYDKTAYGNISDAFLILTGAPVYMINTDAEEEWIKSSYLGNVNEVEYEGEEEKKG
jgi:hypothetical protein